MHTRKKKIPINELVHKGLPTNLLSLSSVATNVGAILLYTGAAIAPHKVLKELQRQVRYFASRKHDLYEVHPTRERSNLPRVAANPSSRIALGQYAY